MRYLPVYLVAVCVLFSEVPLYAQLNNPAEPAFIVIGPDTIRGYAHYSRGRTLYRYVRFSKTETGPKKKYNSSDIDAYFLQNTRQLFLGEKRIPRKGTGDSLFARVLVTGPVDLLHIQRTNNSSNFLAIKRAESFELEKGKMEIRTIASQEFKVAVKPYLRTFEKLFSDCSQDTLSFDYSKVKLTKAVSDYATCRGVRPVVYSEARNATFTFGLTAGLGGATLKFTDSRTQTRPYEYPSIAPLGYYDLRQLTENSSSSLFLAFGVSASYYPGNAKHISLSGDLLFSSRHWTAPRVAVDLHYVQLPLAVRYNFVTKSKLQPIVGAGLDFHVPYKTNFNERDYEWTFTRATPRRGGDTYPDEFPVNMPAFIEKEFTPATTMPFFVAGLQYFFDNRDLLITYRTSVGGSITTSPIFESSVANKMLTISLSFWKKK